LIPTDNIIVFYSSLIPGNAEGGIDESIKQKICVNAANTAAVIIE